MAAPGRLGLALLLSLARLPCASPSVGAADAASGSGMMPLPPLPGRGGRAGARAGITGGSHCLGPRRFSGSGAAGGGAGLRLRGGQVRGDGFMGEGEDFNDVDPKGWGPENDHDGWLKPGEEFSKIHPRLQMAGSHEEFTPEEYTAMGVEGACYDAEGNVQFVPPGYTLEEALQEIQDGCDWLREMGDEAWIEMCQKLLDEKWRPYVKDPCDEAFQDGGFEAHPERLAPAQKLVEESAQLLENMGYTKNERGNYVPPQDKHSREQEAEMRAQWDAFMANKRQEEELAMQAAGMDPSAAAAASQRPVDPVAALVQQYEAEEELGLHEQLETDVDLGPDDGQPAVNPSGGTAASMGQASSGSFQAVGAQYGGHTAQGMYPGSMPVPGGQFVHGQPADHPQFWQGAPVQQGFDAMQG